MKLIGMLDSPYVRRVAIALQCLGQRFEHQPLSVFRTYDQFRAINPVVKAPTLVCDDGTVLMDSTLMLQYAQALAPQRRLLPAEPAALARDLRLVGLALAAAEKSVQFYYEQALRPAERRHQPWVDRVTQQAHAAFGALEDELGRAPLALAHDTIGDAGITIAVAWHFTQATVPGLVPAARHPRLAALSQAAEALPAFQAAPHGDGTCTAGLQGSSFGP